MKIRKIITGLLLTAFLNINLAYAENWVTITAENGKSADLDLDSVQMSVDAVEYVIKTENDNCIYINKMSSELYKEGSPTAVIERAKYKDDIKVADEKIQKRTYKELKSGTLQAEIFDVLSKELDKKTFTQGKTTWKKYLKKQRKTLQKSWKPYKNVWNAEKESTPVNYNNLVLTVAKDGTIEEKLNDNGTLNGLVKLDSLPEDYAADTFQLKVKMNHYKYVGAKIHTSKPVIKQTSPVSAEITVAKNQRPIILGHLEYGLRAIGSAIGEFLYNVFTSDVWDKIFEFVLTLVLLPLAILLALCGET